MAITKTPICASGTLRAFAALLSYPTEALRAHLDELRQVLRNEGALPDGRLTVLTALIDELRDADLMDLESSYVETFDRGRATSLHLFEHVHGDSRDRGPAMIDLARTYEAAGLYLAQSELPDYLPVVLEFVSTQPTGEALAFLGEMGHLFGAIAAGLRRRNSPYAGVLDALVELSGAPPGGRTSVPDEPLDQAWAEPPVFSGCSVQGQSRSAAVQPARFVSAASHDSSLSRHSGAA